jgi:molecular chaperone GrpE
VAEPVCSEIYLKGYKLKDRVIRHAKVQVSMPETDNKQNQEEGQKNE